MPRNQFVWLLLGYDVGKALAMIPDRQTRTIIVQTCKCMAIGEVWHLSQALFMSAFQYNPSTYKGPERQFHDLTGNDFVLTNFNVGLANVTIRRIR
jgi:hypothetical protein